MKQMFLILTLVLIPLTAVAQDKPEKTIIEDQAEADLLSGRHLFSQYGLTSGYLPGFYSEFGDAFVIKKDNSYTIEASHTCYYPNFRYPDYIEGGYVRLKGTITKVFKNSFTMTGTLESFEDDDVYQKKGDEEYCKYDGEMTFSRKGHPKYWRLQKAGDICNDNRYRYVDIFTKDITENEPNKYCYPTAEDAAAHSDEFR